MLLAGGTLRMEIDVRTSTVRAVLLYGLSLVLVIAPFIASKGFFIIDEVIYFLSVDAFRSGQGLFVDNGASLFRSEDLGMGSLLVAQEPGYAPQYPPGLAVIGPVLIEIFGARGLLLLNALATVATLFVTHALAMRLFGRAEVATLSVALFAVFSFAGEYAVGYWPHMVSVLSVTASFFLFLCAMDKERPLVLATASGLALGAGLFFRVDGVFLLGAIAVLTALYAKRPLVVIMGGGLGLLPAIAGLSYANVIKFGTMNPISYGKSGGDGADPSTYLGFALVAALVPVALWGFRMRGGFPRKLALACAGLAVLGYVFVPQIARLAHLSLQGFHSLFIDATAIPDVRPGMSAGPGGTLSFWGLPKKALGQSLPWLGLIAALCVLPIRAQRRSIVIILVFTALWSVPFVLRSWHGGLGSNMRYFLPFLPAVSALVAWIIVEIWSRLESGSRPMLLGAAIAWVASSLWVSMSVSGLAGVHQILSTYVLIAVAVLVVLGLARENLRALSGVAVGLGLSMALINSWSDIRQGQLRRDFANSYASEINKIAQQLIVYGAPEIVIYADGEVQAISAISFEPGQFDQDFVKDALTSNFRVIVPEGMTNYLGDNFVLVEPTPADLPPRYFEIGLAR